MELKYEKQRKKILITGVKVKKWNFSF